MLYFLQQVLNGLHAGALYALLAFGYALTNGVLHRTNLAYGAIFAFAGQTMILVAVFGWHVLWLTLPATVALGIVAGLAYAALSGAVLVRCVLGPLASRSPNAMVAATLGVSLVLMELGAHRRRDPRFLAAADALHAGDLRRGRRLPGHADRHPAHQLRLVAAAVAAMSFCLARSRFGRHWRAVSDDPAAARLCGVDVAVFLQTVLAGALIAGFAGILAALYYGNISFGDRPDLRPEDPVRHRRRRLSSRPGRAGAGPSASPRRCGPAISRSNGATLPSSWRSSCSWCFSHPSARRAKRPERLAPRNSGAQAPTAVDAGAHARHTLLPTSLRKMGHRRQTRRAGRNAWQGCSLSPGPSTASTNSSANAVSWLILASILVSAGNAVIRKAFNMSSNAWLELQWYLFGAAFLLAAAYTLRQNEHIRIDIVYGMFSRRVQHWIDLLGHVFFLMPFVLLMIYYFVPYVGAVLPDRRGLVQRRRPDHLAGQGAAADRLRPARPAGHFRDHQEDRHHARRHGGPHPLHLGA